MMYIHAYVFVYVYTYMNVYVYIYIYKYIYISGVGCGPDRSLLVDGELEEAVFETWCIYVICICECTRLFKYMYIFKKIVQV